jgi:hypothetical protein
LEPIVAKSGNDIPKNGALIRSATVRQGVICYLSKPLDERAVICCVRRALRQAGCKFAMATLQ